VLAPSQFEVVCSLGSNAAEHTRFRFCAIPREHFRLVSTSRGIAGCAQRQKRRLAAGATGAWDANFLRVALVERQRAFSVLRAYK
jgi:hypothetical protein